MIDMASQFQHASAYGASVLSALGGFLAATAPESTIGQGGLVIGAGGLTGLLILLAREVSPPFIKWAEIQAASRNDRIRLEEELRHVKELREADAARIADLERKLAETDERARKAEDEIQNERLIAATRAELIEKKAREASHMARNVAQKVDANSQRIDEVEKAVGGNSGDRIPIEPEST